MSSPIKRGSIFSISDTRVFRFKMTGSRTCCRLNADSAGQPANSFHLLSHAELPLQHSPLRYVFCKDLHIRAAFVLYSPAAAPHCNESAVFPLPFDFYVLEVSVS